VIFWSRLRSVNSDESGSVLVLVTLLMSALLVLAGLVIDLGGVWGFRSNQQSISDAAAAAGALVVAESGNGQEACESAKSYIVANSKGVSALTGIDCTAFPTFCDSDTAGVSATTVEGRFTITVAYPVADGSPLMDSELRGALAQPATVADGPQCDRFGVAIATQIETTLAKLAGVQTLDASVHTVAMSSLISGGTVPVNLLVLDRTGCQALQSSGNGGIYIEAVYDPVAGVLLQGLAASDSDGSDGCAGADGVIDIEGSNAVMRSDGPAGCANQTGTHLIGGLLAGNGCGRIQTLAPGTPGCNFPACTAGGGNLPNPEPTALYRRLTRAPIDHRYNCKDDYTTIAPSIAWATWALTAANDQDIRRCAKPAAPHIDELIAAVGEVGVPAGFSTWTASGYPCVVQGPPGTTIVVPAGDWYVDCPAFENKRTVVFQGGNVVFAGSVDVLSSATLAINANPVTYSPASPETWVFLRGGVFRKAGDAVLIMNNTTVYASKNAHIEMTGGSGALYWVAPDQGDFNDLALWGDSATTHLWAGQADLTLEGVFFTPFARAEYAGTAGQNQIRAQFVAHSLHARGQGTLIVSPEFGRTVEFPLPPESTLIR
jgi:hypothetical protein